MKKALDNTEPTTQTATGGPSGKGGRLRHLFMGGFLVIALLAAGVGACLLIELGRGPGWLAEIPPDRAAAVVAALRWRIVLGIGMIVMAAGGMFLTLNHRIAAPLEKTAAVTARMAEGYLGMTLPSHPANEIGRIGECINGLAVNFQEALILVWNQTDNAMNRIHRTTGRMRPDEKQRISPEMLADLQSAHQDLETMRMMVRSFDLYEVAIAENDVLKAKEKAETIN
jgi:hypothetical protein